MDERELLRSRLLDADRSAFDRNILKTGGFLGTAEQNLYYALEREFCTTERFLCGGHADADRKVWFFLPDYADRETVVRETIACIRVTPLNERFADDLTHRDFLGALMNLGIERDCIGDILVDGSACAIFCLSGMAELICGELTRVKHTSVTAVRVDASEVTIRPRFEELHVNVASERLDAIVAAVYKLSRQKAAALIDREEVLVSGRPGIQSGKTLKEGDRVSVRGYGKFLFEGVSGSSRKGRLYVDIKRYI